MWTNCLRRSIKPKGTTAGGAELSAAGYTESRTLCFVLTLLFWLRGDLHGANYAVWLAGHLLADLKFMSIFSMLFGAGIFLMTSHIEASGQRPTRLHYRRMGWLMLFGLLHGSLLWYGDILYDYALCGMLVYLFRKRRPRTLIITGILLFSVAPCFCMATDTATRRSRPMNSSWSARECGSRPRSKLQSRMLSTGVAGSRKCRSASRKRDE